MKIDERLAAQGERLREIREKFSRSPEEVASFLKFGNRQTVYDLEAGRRDIKAFEAMQLAQYYSMSTETLLSGRSQAAPVVFWRGEADVAAENLLLTRLERYSRLQKLLDVPFSASMPFFSLSENSSFEYVAETAGSVADMLKLGRYPARVLAESVRRQWNVIVFHAPLEDSSGACVRGDGVCGVLLNSNEVWWRRNFSFGHELFHLLFGDCDSVKENRLETLANVFASNLLMPCDHIRSDVLRLRTGSGFRYFDLMNLAREYMVSTEALLWRMHSLELIDREVVEGFNSSAELRALDRDVHGEPERDRSSLPQHMVMLAYRVYLNGNISVGKLAEYLETSAGKLKKTLESRGIDPFAEYYETSLGNT